MRSTELKIGDIVECKDKSLYIIREFVEIRGETRALFDVILEMYPPWAKRKNLRYSLPLDLLTKITHAEGLDE